MLVKLTNVSICVNKLWFVSKGWSSSSNNKILSGCTSYEKKIYIYYNPIIQVMEIINTLLPKHYIHKFEWYILFASPRWKTTIKKLNVAYNGFIRIWWPKLNIHPQPNLPHSQWFFFPNSFTIIKKVCCGHVLVSKLSYFPYFPEINRFHIPNCILGRIIDLFHQPVWGPRSWKILFKITKYDNTTVFLYLLYLKEASF